MTLSFTFLCQVLFQDILSLCLRLCTNTTATKDAIETVLALAALFEKAQPALLSVLSFSLIISKSHNLFSQSHCWTVFDYCNNNWLRLMSFYSCANWPQNCFHPSPLSSCFISGGGWNGVCVCLGGCSMGEVSLKMKEEGKDDHDGGD